MVRKSSGILGILKVGSMIIVLCLYPKDPMQKKLQGIHGLILPQIFPPIKHQAEGLFLCFLSSQLGCLILTPRHREKCWEKRSGIGKIFGLRTDYILQNLTHKRYTHKNALYDNTFLLPEVEQFHVVKQDKSEGDIERVKATIMLCYGYVALYSPPSLIISRMEATILRTISPYFTNVRVSCKVQTSNVRKIFYFAKKCEK